MRRALACAWLALVVALPPASAGSEASPELSDARADHVPPAEATGADIIAAWIEWNGTTRAARAVLKLDSLPDDTRSVFDLLWRIERPNVVEGDPSFVGVRADLVPDHPHTLSSLVGPRKESV